MVIAGPPPRMAMGPPPPRYATRGRDGDVSASQAFIYRYERALHGLNAQAAEEAWGHGDRDRDHQAMRQGEEAGRRVTQDGHMWAYEGHGDMDRERADRERMDQERLDQQRRTGAS